MKKIFVCVAMVTLFAACNTKKDETKRDMLFVTDTSALNSNVNADTAMVNPAPAAVVMTPLRNTSSTRTRSYNNNNTGTRRSTASSGNNNSGSGTNNSGTVAQAPARKKGWSKAAKGAAIGGVAGAATGAIITKSGKGAIIGGVIGAGGGYIIGRNKDKKDGRVN